MIAYILSLLLSVPALVLCITSMFVELRFFGLKEVAIMLGVSFIFLLIGSKSDTNARKEIMNG